MSRLISLILAIVKIMITQSYDYFNRKRDDKIQDVKGTVKVLTK